MDNTKRLSFCLRLLAASILLASGVGKQIGAVDFAIAVQQFLGISETAGILVASTLPALEIIVAIGLLSRDFAAISLLLTGILGSIFVSAHIYTFFFSKSTSSCNCFGHLISVNPNHTFLLSIILVLISLLPYSRYGIETNCKASHSELFSRKRLILSSSIILLLSFSLIHRVTALQRELKNGLINLASSNQEAKTNLEEIVRSLPKKDPSAEATLFLFLRSPGCQICQNELSFWNTNLFNKKVELVAIFPKSTSDRPHELLKKDLERHLVWNHNLHLVDDDLSEKVLGYKNYVGRVLVSHSNRIIGARGDLGSEVERYEFVSSLQNHFAIF
jgi:hypothetical protein